MQVLSSSLKRTTRCPVYFLFFCSVKSHLREGKRNDSHEQQLHRRREVAGFGKSSLSPFFNSLLYLLQYIFFAA